MDLETLTSNLIGLLPPEVRVMASKDYVESEPVGWDFYGNVTEVEYTVASLVDEVSITVYWDEPTGFVGVELKIPNSTLGAITTIDAERMARMVVSTMERRR